MTFTVLLTCVGDEFGPNLINILKSSQRHKIRVVGTDTNGDCSGKFFCDAFYKVSNGNNSNFMNEISSIVSKEKINLIIPKADEEALTLSMHRELVESKNCQLACSHIDIIKCLNDKSLTYTHLENNDMPTPVWKLSNNKSDLKNTIDEFLSFSDSLVIKPTNSRGARDVYIISKDKITNSNNMGRENHYNYKDFIKIKIEELQFLSPMIVMEKLVEPVFDIDLLAHNGEPIHVIPRRRINSEEPNNGHFFPNSEELVLLGKKIIKVFNLNWLYDADIMFNKDGTPFVLEINPRPSGSLSASIAAGYPLLDDLISIAKNEKTSFIKKFSISKVIPFKSLGPVQSDL
ncbi:ATP-grasp domain-containing protein [Alphaproteobacteria bacterium]|nr:ATP-grasp domain-containing protein [Alphaproteobacteria bacterium]